MKSQLTNADDRIHPIAGACDLKFASILFEIPGKLSVGVNTVRIAIVEWGEIIAKRCGGLSSRRTKGEIVGWTDSRQGRKEKDG